MPLVADRYGDNGKVCVSIVRKEALDTAELDSFLMSCRVLGRFIEDQILDQLVKELRNDGLSKLRVHFIPTKKNAPARAFIERLQGGRLISDEEGGAKTWEFDIATASPVTKTGYAELLTPKPSQQRRGPRLESGPRHETQGALGRRPSRVRALGAYGLVGHTCAGG